MKIESREINLKNIEHKDFITKQIEDWIEAGENQKVMEGMREIWAINSMYYEGYQMPIGFTDDSLAEAAAMLDARGFLDTNKFRTRKDAKNRIWITNNKIKNIVDGIKAYITGSRKEITVKSDDYPGNDGIEYGIKQILRSITTRKRLWDELWNPCIDFVQLFGLGWYDVIFNRLINPPYGDFQFNYYHPKDVLMDPYARKRYFQDATFIIRKRQMELEEAKRYFRQKMFIVDPDKVNNLTGDSEYNNYNPYNINLVVPESKEMVTVYYGEYTQKYNAKMKLIDELGLNDLLREHGISVPDEEKETVDYEERWMFDFVYTSALGCVYHGEAKYNDKTEHEKYQYACIPMVNRESNVRQHPVSDVEKLAKYQDIINLAESLIFHNAREQNFVRYVIKKAFQKYEKQFMKFLEGSGVFWLEDVGEKEKVSDIMVPVKTEALPPEIMLFLKMAVEDIKENGVIHESLAGEYPSKGQISGVAVSNLREANLQRLEYKNRNINWSVTTAGERLYRIYAMEYRMDDFIKILDRSKSDPKHIVLNGTFTMQEYVQYVAENYPEMDVMSALKEFELHNDVETQFAFTNTNGLPNMPEEIFEQKSVVYVNHLLDTKSKKPYRMDIKIELDFETEKKELETSVKAVELRGRGDMSRKDMYKYLGDPFKDNYDEIKRNIEEEDVTLRYAKILRENPQLIDILQQIMSKKQVQGQSNQKQLPG